MQTFAYQPRIPDEDSLRAYSAGTLDMGSFEEQGFSIYEVREGMLRLKLPIPGWEITGAVSPALREMLQRRTGDVSPRDR